MKECPATAGIVNKVAFAGGSADKVGNEYETWWTLRRVTQLLRGELDAMAVEPLGADGAELWVDAKGVRTYDQVKFRSSGRWTPSKLRSDGILAKLGRHYASGSQVLLVLSQPSEELEHLIALAGATSSGAELWRAATSKNDLDLLSDAWAVGREETRAFLLQTSVRHDGLPHLKEFVELAIDTLVLGDPRFAIGVLRGFLEESVTTVFTAPQVWAVLEANGLRARPRLEPGPTVERLKDALERHVRAVRRSAPDGGTILRRESKEVVDSITESNAPVLLVVGRAGAGKSVVVADAAAELARQGRHVAALRLDRLDPRTSTAAQLGAAMDLERSPVLSLSEVSPKGFDGILVIDQLDAVSNYSGRMPTVYEAVDEAMTQARLLGNVRIILAVRSVDLEEDPRLRKLAGEDVPTVVVGELAADEVLSYLAQIGADSPSPDAATLQLLRLPIHLYVFSELDPGMRSAAYATLTSLYGAFTRSIRNRLELSGHVDHWQEVSRVLVERMNADEALAVPAAALEHISPLYVGALISANVILEQEGRLSLFHETYFDYLFAKSFTQRGEALVDWFAKTGQGLFRRSQLRQLLEYIATEERREFIDQVLAIVDSALRPHLISIAYTVLSSITPTAGDWKAIRQLTAAENPFAIRVISLISGPQWFAVIDEAGDVEGLLDNSDWGEVAAGLVGRLSREIPDRVLELLRARQARGEAWVLALRHAVDAADSVTWADFSLEQGASGGLDLPGQPFDVLETSLFRHLVNSDPSAALRVLTVALSREVDQLIADGVPVLDDAVSRRGRHSVDAEDIEQLASNCELAFIEALVPLFEKIANYGPVHGRRVWRYRFGGKHRDFADDLFFTFDDALTRFTRTYPDRAIPILVRLSSHRTNSLDFLVCRALHSAPSDMAVDWILEVEERRMLGWMSDVRWETRRLIERASRTCSEDRFTALESAILYWNPEYPDAVRTLRWNGWAELQLLSALAFDRLSPTAKRRLAELHRKYPEWEPSEPMGMSGGIVQSPIGRDAAVLMTDANWLRAIDKYEKRGSTTFEGGGAFGGTAELAYLMGSLAKQDPARFLALALGFRPTTPAAYTEQILRSVAGEADQLEILPLIRKFRADYPIESGKAVASAIDEYAGELGDELFSELLLLVEDPDPSVELARVVSGSGFYFGGDFDTAGINSTRGLVANTLASVLFANGSRSYASLPTLQRLVNDPIVAVRALATGPALAYASIHRSDGLQLIEQLLDNHLILSSSIALRSLRWAMLWEADRFAPILERALAAEDAKLAGALWANCAVNAALGSAPLDVASLSESARVGVAEAIMPDPGLATSILATLLNDPSRLVRQKAALSAHYLDGVDVDARNDFIAQFVESAAFADAAVDLLDTLEGLPGDLPPVTWEVCRRAIETFRDSGPAGGGMLATDVIAILVRLYRSSDDAGREAALDLIDQTVLMQLWRFDEALDKAR